MIAYEAWDLAQSAYGNSMAAYAIFLSITSGYLVTAYLVGRELTTTQFRLLTTFFLVVAAILIWSMSSYVYSGNAFSQLALEMVAAARNEHLPMTVWSVTRVQSWFPEFFALINSLTIFGSIFFMWNVRRPKRTGGN
jgi:hypothetical protein